MAYNQQLALAAVQQQMFVSQTVVLADMEIVQVSDGDSTDASVSTAYRYPCRCGGAYWFDATVMNDLQGSLLIQCDTCSSNTEVYLTTPS